MNLQQLKLSRRVGNKCDILCAFCSDSQESDFNSSSSSRGSQSTDEESGTYLLFTHFLYILEHKKGKSGTTITTDQFHDIQSQIRG